MPVDVAEESLDLMIELLEAGAPTAESLPYPTLGRTDRLERRTFRIIVLQNPYLRATVVPDLGGRILRLQDRRTQTDIWPFSHSLNLTAEPKRGVSSQDGFQVLTDFESRLNSMGVVATAPDFSEDEEEAGGMWWGELCGNGLSLNCRYTMPPDQPYLEVEVRAFNRTLDAVYYNGGFSIDPSEGDWRRSAEGWLWKGRSAEVFLESDALDFAEGGAIHRFRGRRSMAPRQLDSWKVRLYPSSVGASLRGATAQVAVGWNREELIVSPAIEAAGSKIVVRIGEGATMELPIDLRPDLQNRISLESLKSEIAELAILDPKRVELIRASQLPDPVEAKREPSDLHCVNPALDDTEAKLRHATFDLRQRHVAHLLLGYRRLAEKDYAEASQAFEQSLLFNAEDHLTWWFKALADRLQGGEPEERPELLNAHFLAPLEPALRAESYLASPSQAKEKTAVLNPLEETPEAFIEVACLLLEANLLEEAVKWLDEALRHIDLPMLRYLLAYAYLKGSRMEVEAAEQVQSAVRPEPGPPYPWRPMERKALQELQARFPADGSIKRLLNLAG